MLGAPHGFIPLKDGVIVNARSIDSVSVLEPLYFLNPAINPKKEFGINIEEPILAIKCSGATWYINMSMQQFIARMIEAMEEIDPTTVKKEM